MSAATVAVDRRAFARKALLRALLALRRGDLGLSLSLARLAVKELSAAME